MLHTSPPLLTTQTTMWAGNDTVDEELETLIDMFKMGSITTDNALLYFMKIAGRALKQNQELHKMVMNDATAIDAVKATLDSAMTMQGAHQEKLVQLEAEAINSREAVFQLANGAMAVAAAVDNTIAACEKLNNDATKLKDIENGLRFDQAIIAEKLEESRDLYNKLDAQNDKLLDKIVQVNAMIANATDALRLTVGDLQCDEEPLSSMESLGGEIRIGPYTTISHH